MAQTKIPAVYGFHPPCWSVGRIQERKQSQEEDRQRRLAEKPAEFCTYEDSSSEEKSEIALKEAVNTSYNFVDYVKHRETQTSIYSSVSKEYGHRHILTHGGLFEHTQIDLGHDMKKVLCSQWLSDRLILFGTKCNKLMIYDVQNHEINQIPSIVSSVRREIEDDEQTGGIYSVQLNPSKTLLATVAENNSEVAVYKIPTFDPVCVGENAHINRVDDICWLDDQFLVSGDTELALWRVTDDILDAEDEVAAHKTILPVSLEYFHNSEKIRAIKFNKSNREIATLNENHGTIVIWDAEKFQKKMARKFSHGNNTCMTLNENDNIYAIGNRNLSALLDCRTLQIIKKIPPIDYYGFHLFLRSASFTGDILTLGLDLGKILFFDLKAGKFLESSVIPDRTIRLKATKGYVFPDVDILRNDEHSEVKYGPAIMTHCYNSSGTRLFIAGGPNFLPNFTGNYAGLFQ
ncbi:unnamed protein product [Ceutorhynchus assimilis]|uniref:DDB1- and CUL4-associated factor 12 beta-propeller domain-containing protein n=1 Tax=Ceutorhynchus assimilis TaxID=467358 RepID=A0A9N9MDX6_9CUCU|nr:unnamed protein product [Ceutorhynchus assimilis]